MIRSKLFENEGCQAVQLPEGCRFTGDEVALTQFGDIVFLSPLDSKWNGFLDSLTQFSDDFMAEDRIQASSEEREELG